MGDDDTDHEPVPRNMVKICSAVSSETLVDPHTSYAGLCIQPAFVTFVIRVVCLCTYKASESRAMWHAEQMRSLSGGTRYPYATSFHNAEWLKVKFQFCNAHCGRKELTGINNALCTWIFYEVFMALNSHHLCVIAGAWILGAVGVRCGCKAISSSYVQLTCD